jgi:CHAT domain-containing protein
MEAELATTKALASDGSNPQWLEAGAEADLFRWNYANALEALQRVRASEPELPRLNADLALAYFERAEAEGRGADYSSAAEALSKAIERSPGSAELRFNRAVVYERLFLYSQSSSEWKESIRLEAQGGWADEARSHLAEIGKKNVGGDPPITPHNYLAMRGSGLDPELALRPATESWLQLAARGGASAKAETIDALRALAADLDSVKHDRWLRELLRSLDHPQGSQAFSALAESVHANSIGHAANAGRFAAESHTLFEKIGNRAGVLYSSFEANYAQQRAMRRADCAVANASLSRTIPREFAWLGVQVWTERGVCEYASGNAGAAWADYATAVRLAKEAGYREPTVRPLSYQNDFRADLGDSGAAWQGTLSGLAEIWSRPHDVLSPYHCYARIFSLASRARDWNTALAVKREAIVNAASMANPSLLAVNHYQAGTVALSAGDHAAADDEFKRAQELFQTLPLDDQIRAYLFYCALGKAEAEMTAGNLRQSETHLREIAAQSGSFSDAKIQLRYEDLLGRVNLKLGDLSKAAAAFQTARDLAMKNRESLHDPRQLAEWMNTNGDLYHSLVDLRLRQDPQEQQAWLAWREYLGSPIPPTIGLSICFAILPDRVVAWFQEGTRRTAHSSKISAPELAALVTEFRRECSDPRTPIAKIRRAGGKLYRLLLQPYADRLHGHIWIEPDGILAGMPWEALVTASGKWAGDEATYIIALDGIRNGASLATTPHLHMLAVAASNGVPDHTPELLPLPDAAREARAVGAMFPNAVVLTGNDATFDNVRQAIPNTEIFHFAGHHGDSGLLLSAAGGQPGILDLNSFAAPGRAMCRLAVLSACQTSAAFTSDEWDPDTLIRTLHRYGVQAVVASRWSVDSAVTASFMQRFYEFLLSGNTVDTGLQNASQVIREQPGATHPYYWAAFASFQ